MTGPQSDTWVNNLGKDDLKEYAERGLELKLGEVYSNSALHVEDIERIGDAMEGLIHLFGIGTTEWQNLVANAEGTSATLIGAVGHIQYDVRDVRRMAAGKSLGDFVMDRAYWAVPIESDDDATGEFSLTLQLDDGLLATIKSDGFQEVYRDYFDASTGERLSDPVEEMEEKAVLGEATTDISAVHTNISYSVAFATSHNNIR